MENRWWEYYVVRYFVGSVLGAVIILFLKAQPNLPLQSSLAALGDFKDSTFLGVSLIASLGFAFCYVASAPILTLHATRAHLRLSVLKIRWLSYAAALLIPTAIVTVAAWRAFSWPVAIAVGLILGTQIGLVIAAVFTNFSDIESYYRSLATDRSNASTKKDEPASPGMEYVTSYRHYHCWNLTAIEPLRTQIVNGCHGPVTFFVTPGKPGWPARPGMIAAPSRP